MHGQIIAFPAFTETERAAMTRPPEIDEDALRWATNQLIAALYNYRQVKTGQADHLVSYLDVPPILREYFYRSWAIPEAEYAIWRDAEAV